MSGSAAVSVADAAVRCAVVGFVSGVPAWLSCFGADVWAAFVGAFADDSSSKDAEVCVEAAGFVVFAVEGVAFFGVVFFDAVVFAGAADVGAFVFVAFGATDV